MKLIEKRYICERGNKRDPMEYQSFAFAFTVSEYNEISVKADDVC